ncbi:hypothetical protein CBER1_10205 [Cercospora berteroae]|uniref:SCP2 domain-containing protein n=1 Tax=Cercospora berteroae TaxID=357750 RepID=A0A2S6CER5_9PEZI|nr:hypothetical protein CBER1_10205 [Cercospora berteroae]
MGNLASDNSSTRVFDNIRQTIIDNQDTSQKAIKEIGGIFAFELAGDEGGVWHVDLKESGTVNEGFAPQGKAYDVLFQLEVSDFEQPIDETEGVSNELSSSGRMTVSGKTELAAHLEKVFELGRDMPNFGTL